jgi:hypothetical protein
MEHDACCLPSQNSWLTFMQLAGPVGVIGALVINGTFRPSQLVNPFGLRGFQYGLD